MPLLMFVYVTNLLHMCTCTCTCMRITCTHMLTLIQFILLCIIGVNVIRIMFYNLYVCAFISTLQVMNKEVIFRLDLCGLHGCPLCAFSLKFSFKSRKLDTHLIFCLLYFSLGNLQQFNYFIMELQFLFFYNNNRVVKSQLFGVSYMDSFAAVEIHKKSHIQSRIFIS